MSSEEQIRHIWTAGSYPEIGRDFLEMAAHLVVAADVTDSDRVLDVGCGTGNVAITAARRGADVTGLDITPDMLDDARENAAIAGVEEIEWRQGNAVDLPFDDDTFDVTLSCVGHMFANPPEAAGAELTRVTRSGGRIAFISWTPASVVPAMAMAMQPYLPDDPDGPPPVLWGDQEVVRERLGDSVTDLTFETATLTQPSLSPKHSWEYVQTKSGLFIVSLETVDEADIPALEEDSIATIDRYFDDDRNVIEMEYLLSAAMVA